MTDSKLKNDLILRVAKGEKTERIPVWLMRQAGRILSEYRAVREKAGSFIHLATTPALAAEVTLQPIDILDVDAAIIFSDILVVPEAMGLPYEMIESKGPRFPHPIQTEEDLKRLKVADVYSDLGYVLEAIKLVKKELDGRVPLIGFAGAPFTIFCYIVEGSGSKTFSKAKKMLYQRPDLAHQILQLITQSTVSYLKAQIEAGADLVQLFDSWAGILSPKQYAEFSHRYIAQIFRQLPNVPKIVFAKGAFFARSLFATHTDCQVIGLDWNMDAKESRAIVGKKVLQGNLDPCALYAQPWQVEQATKEMLEEFGFSAHIANLGHGVYPDTPVENVKVFIQTVKEYSEKRISMLKNY